jgi:hypothetical protein
MVRCSWRRPGMRRIALLLASLIASAALIIFLVPARASVTSAVLHKGGGVDATDSEGVQLVRRGGGGFCGSAFRGGFRGPAFRGFRAF